MGSNIQWLRISGAYVGAVTGFIIFIVIKFPAVGLPILIFILIILLLSPKLREKIVSYSE